MLELLIIAAATAAVLLAWDLHQKAGTGRTAGNNDTRRATSRLLGSGELLQGSRRRRVALEVTDSTLYYKGSSTSGSLELESILEIEYDTVTAAGLDIRNGRVLRLRSESGTIEFVLPRDTVTNWYLILPPRPERVRPAVVPAATATIASQTTPLAWHR